MTVPSPHSEPVEYAEAGKHYRFSDIDHEELARWSLGLNGQVIVCENEGANWLPFSRLASVKSSRRRTSREVIWSNRDMSEQLEFA